MSFAMKVPGKYDSSALNEKEIIIDRHNISTGFTYSNASGDPKKPKTVVAVAPCLQCTYATNSHSGTSWHTESQS